MPLPDERSRGSVANLIGRFEKHQRQNSGDQATNNKTPLQNTVSNSPFLRSSASSGNLSKASSILLKASPTSPVRENPTSQQQTVKSDAPEPTPATPAKPSVVTDTSQVEEKDPFSGPPKQEGQTFILNSPSNKTELPSQQSVVRGQGASTSKLKCATVTSGKPARTIALSRPPPTASASVLARTTVPTSTTSSFAKPTAASALHASTSGNTLTRARSTPSLKAKAAASVVTKPTAPPPVPPLRPQHTGTSTASTAVRRRENVPHPPPVPVEVPRRAKTPSSGVRAKTPSTVPVNRVKVPSSSSTNALYAPTAASLARAKANQEARASGHHASASASGSLSSSTSAPIRRAIKTSGPSAHVMAPTAASLARSTNSSKAPPASAHNTPMKSSVSASGSRRVLITAPKAVPGRDRSSSFASSEAVAKVPKSSLTSGTTASNGAPAANGSADAAFGKVYTPPALIDQGHFDSEDDHSLAEETPAAVGEVRRMNGPSVGPLDQASESTESKVTPLVYDYIHESNGLNLEHIVAMLEGTNLPPLREPTQPKELEKEKTEEIGGYEDDTEDLPNIPDVE